MRNDHFVRCVKLHHRCKFCCDRLNTIRRFSGFQNGGRQSSYPKVRFVLPNVYKTCLAQLIFRIHCKCGWNAEMKYTSRTSIVTKYKLHVLNIIVYHWKRKMERKRLSTAKHPVRCSSASTDRSSVGAGSCALNWSSSVHIVTSYCIGLSAATGVQNIGNQWRP